MKKTMRVIFLMTICGVCMLSTNKGNASGVSRVSDLADRIELCRFTHTTRSVPGNQIGDPVVDAVNYQTEIEMSIKNYRGSVVVEIVAAREVKRTYFDVYDNRTEIINTSSLRAGTYTLRIILDSEELTGSFKIASYGR